MDNVNLPDAFSLALAALTTWDTTPYLQRRHAANPGALLQAVEQLSKEYRQLYAREVVLDFEIDELRYTYTYNYVAANLAATSEVMAASPEVCAFLGGFQGRPLHVLCIGGGPGSDALGVINVSG